MATIFGVVVGAIGLVNLLKQETEKLYGLVRNAKENAEKLENVKMCWSEVSRLLEGIKALPKDCFKVLSDTSKETYITIIDGYKTQAEKSKQSAQDLVAICQNKFNRLRKANHVASSIDKLQTEALQARANLLPLVQLHETAKIPITLKDMAATAFEMFGEACSEAWKETEGDREKMKNEISNDWDEMCTGIANDWNEMCAGIGEDWEKLCAELDEEEKKS